MKKIAITSVLLICTLVFAVACSNQNPEVIGAEKAIEIALEKAGLFKNDVFMESTELDRDNGIWKYEVEFRKGRTEYSADIKADDGTVLSWEVDMDD